MDTARIAYDNAVSSLASARVAAAHELERYGTSLEAARISANTESRRLALQKLENQLGEATVRAPAAGTVTAVYAKVGSAATGLLFVIEDAENLMVKTKIREYDLSKVAPGMPVKIKTNSTGDAEFKGVFASLDPTAIKNAAGETDASSDVQFAATVSVVQPETPLKIGMSARLSIITAQKQDVFYVPYDAIATDSAGEEAIYTIAADESGKQVARKVSVKPGMYTDFYVEVEGDGLQDGMKIISDASGGAIFDGAAVKTKDAAAQSVAERPARQ
jgi:multidrug efflux pump subunit AcrA (membrane-fusion protein)